MATVIKCPMCKRPLEVPEELMGKRVKCPGCKMIFTASPPGSEPPKAPAGRRSEPEEGIRRKRPAPPDDDEEDEEEEEERPRVRKKPTRRPEEDYEDEEEEDEDEEDEDEEEEKETYRRRRPRRLSSSRQRAKDAVLAPAICLMVVGGLGVTLMLVSLGLRLAGVALFAAANEGNPGGAEQSAAYVAGSFMGVLVGSCWGGVIILGALQMKNLTSYGYAMTASIVAMVPCNICCLLGLPFGIWALIVINRSDVKSAFG